MIPVNEPALGERELELVADCVRSGWVSSAGRYYIPLSSYHQSCRLGLDGSLF